MSRCRFVSDHQADYPVAKLCRLAGVARSSFYAWRERPPSAREVANKALLEEIRVIHEASRCTYGRVRMVGQLRRRGIGANHKRVARLMRMDGIRGLGGPGKRGPRRSGRHTAPAPDLLNRDFSADGPDQRWVADIERHEALLNRAVVKGHRLRLVAAGR